MQFPPFPASAVAWLRRSAWLAAAGVAAGLLGAGFLVTDGLRDRPGRADVALVPGGGTDLNGQPSRAARGRLDRALEQYRRGDYPWIIVSGRIERRYVDEAAAMRDYLVVRGVPRERIIADNGSLHTYESARFTARLLRTRGWRSVCVVTQYYHVPRVRLALERFGVSPVYSAHARYSEGRDASAVLRELAACVEYALRPYPDPSRQAAPPPVQTR